MRYKKEENPEMFSIAGNPFYFDLETLSKFIKVERSESIDAILREAKKEMNAESGTNSTENDEIDPDAQIVDVTKWETTKVMIECVLSEQGPLDEAMGFEKLNDQLSIPFKLSFNTLLKNKIIKQ